MSQGFSSGFSSAADSLSSNELFVTLSVELDEPMLNSRVTDVEDDIREKFSPLVEVENGHVCLVHLSLHQFLLSQSRPVIPKYQPVAWIEQASLRKHGNIVEAVKCFSLAISLREMILGNDHPETVQAVLNLARPEEERSNFHPAVFLYRRS